MARILIVEDDALVSRMYQQAFEFDGYEVCEDVHSVFGHFLVTYLREHSKNS